MQTLIGRVPVRVVCLLVLAGIACDRECGAQQVPERPLVVAHRGLLRESPENTLSNFRACLELRLGFEMDVLRSRDGKLVCIHDQTVDRTTDGEGRVDELTYRQIQALDAGSWFDDKFAGQRVPSIDAVFRLLAEYPEAGVLVAVDIKQDDTRVEGELVRLARRHDVLDRLLFIGRAIVEEPVRERLRKADGRAQVARVAHDSEELVGSIADPLTNWVYVRYLPSEEEVRKIHQKGKRVFIAGSSVAGLEVLNWRRAREVGLDAILTDYSLELSAQLRE
ncbi:MAG: glycerophosphodiester phosphodiesterase family protein [Pirellulaceae bacterium]